MFDTLQGCAILSGDTLGEMLAANFPPRRFLFVTDVDGVYDCDPKSAPVVLSIIFSMYHDWASNVIYGITVCIAYAQDHPARRLSRISVDSAQVAVQASGAATDGML